MNDWNHGFLGGLLAGIAVGGILAILYAPEKGEKTRKRLNKKKATWSGRASDALGSASEIVDKGRKRMGI
ncbi:MAG: YtxH domain-containing protein [Gemmatimonadota bacterium]